MYIIKLSLCIHSILYPCEMISSIVLFYQQLKLNEKKIYYVCLSKNSFLLCPINWAVCSVIRKDHVGFSWFY